MYWYESRHIVVACSMTMVYLIILFLQVQQSQNQALLYVDVCHSDNHPAAALLPVEPEKVVYADVNGKATDKTTEDSVCTGRVSSNVKDEVLSVVLLMFMYTPNDHAWLIPSMA